MFLCGKSSPTQWPSESNEGLNRSFHEWRSPEFLCSKNSTWNFSEVSFRGNNTGVIRVRNAFLTIFFFPQTMVPSCILPTKTSLQSNYFDLPNPDLLGWDSPRDSVHSCHHSCPLSCSLVGGNCRPHNYCWKFFTPLIEKQREGSRGLSPRDRWNGSWSLNGSSFPKRLVQS